MKTNLTDFISIDDRDPASVRAVILARKSSNGSESDVKSQVEVCQKFIKRMGWTLVADPYAYTEIGKSGHYNVVRKVLEAVLALAQQRKVDVIVAREMERLDRDKDRRAFAIGFCDRYDVEWRFANLTPNGKFPDTLDGKMIAAMKEFYGLIEAEMIFQRMEPGRERRYASGLPHGGRYGPPYGYRWQPKPEDAKTYGGYLVDPERAPIVREMFSRFASDENITARELARELNRRGVPTASGGLWTGTQIICMIRNPIYCGRGRRKRWHTTMEEKTDEFTGRKNLYSVTRDRMRNPDPTDYEHSTYPLDEKMVPSLVEPEVWDAAQRGLCRNRKFAGRLRRTNSPHFVEDTLLHGGFVFCAQCGSMMTRHWRRIGKASAPYYRCAPRPTSLVHQCSIHDINALITDKIVLRKLATALTDPEQLMDLADAVEQQSAQAAADIDRAETALAVYREMDATREKARASYVEAITALSAISGNAYRDTTADLRAKLAQLDKEQAKANEDCKQVTREYERALRRKKMLDRLSRFTRRHGIIDLDDETRKITAANEDNGEHVMYKSQDLDVAAELLGMTEAEVKATHIPVNVASLVEDPINDPDREWLRLVDTKNLIEMLLHHAPHVSVRRLLHDLNVRVLIKHPRTKEGRALHGFTPHEERVVVQFLVNPSEAVQVRPSDKKFHDLRSRSR